MKEEFEPVTAGDCPSDDQANDIIDQLDFF